MRRATLSMCKMKELMRPQSSISSKIKLQQEKELAQLCWQNMCDECDAQRNGSRRRHAIRNTIMANDMETNKSFLRSLWWIVLFLWRFYFLFALLVDPSPCSIWSRCAKMNDDPFEWDSQFSLWDMLGLVPKPYFPKSLRYRNGLTKQA